MPPTMAMDCVPGVNCHWLLPLFTTIPLASVRLLRMLSVPLSVRLLPSVMPSSVPLLEVRVLPVKVPFCSVPLRMSNAPPNTPVSRFKVPLAISMVPLRLMTTPPARVLLILLSSLNANTPPRVMVPVLRAMVPVLP